MTNSYIEPTEQSESNSRKAFQLWVGNHREHWNTEDHYQAYCAGVLDVKSNSIQDERNPVQAFHEDLASLIQRYLPHDQVFPTEEAMMLCSRVLTNTEAFDKIEKPYRCPECGYTQKDAAIHMDHYICVEKGGPPMPPKPQLHPKTGENTYKNDQN